MQTRPPIQFSLRALTLLVAGVCIWLTVVHYWGTVGVVVTSPLVGLFFLLVGLAWRMRVLAVVGALLFLVGPLVLGIVSAVWNP